MKRCFSAIVSIVIAASSLFAFSACSSPGNVSAPTDKLVIYGIEGGSEIEWGPAIAIFKELYPDVTVEYQSFSNDNSDQYFQQLRTEVMAGKGPDIIVIDSLNSFVPLAKAADSGAFADINSFLENDDSFSIDEGYHAAAMETGVFDGKRLFVPLSYNVRPVITTEETLTALDVSWDSSMNFWDIVEQADSSKASLFFRDGLWTFSLLPWSGVTPVDYQTKELHLDSEEFRNLMEAYKKAYHYVSNPEDSLQAFRTLQNRDAYCISARNLDSLFINYAALAYEENPVLLSVNGEEPVGQIRHVAWINEGGKNKVNAYNMLKILLGSSYQKKIESGGLPVSEEAANGVINEYLSLVQNTYISDLDATFGTLTEAQISELKTVLTDVTFDQNDNSETNWSIAYYMEPYFKDEKDYDSCLAELENKLQLYLNE